MNAWIDGMEAICKEIAAVRPRMASFQLRVAAASVYISPGNSFRSLYGAKLVQERLL